MKKKLVEYAVFKKVKDPAHPGVTHDYWDGPFLTKREAMAEWRARYSNKGRPQDFVVGRVTTEFLEETL